MGRPLSRPHIDFQQNLWIKQEKSEVKKVNTIKKFSHNKINIDKAVSYKRLDQKTAACHSFTIKINHKDYQVNKSSEK